jgi:CubicO group peptidase (beta-lactamase class C family)
MPFTIGRRTALSLTALLVSAVAGSGNTASPPAAGPYDTTAIRSEFKRQCAEGVFSGVVVVRAGGRELFNAACGEADLVNRLPNTRAVRFKIFSTSKLITALVVMRLVEQGRLGLDTSITAYVDEAPKSWSHVTIRSLLNHTSGVKDLTGKLVAAYRSDWDGAMQTALAGLSPADAELAGPPGDRFAYNNFGFELLALAAERAGGEPFPRLAQRLVFDPAGMKTASFQPNGVLMGHLVDTPEPGLALGYNGAPGALVQATSWSFVQMGAGAIRATADDFMALDQALAAGRIVKSETWREMTAAPVVPPADYPAKGRTFGLGVFVVDVDGVRMQGHTGGTNGFISDFERYPEDGAMMIALSNRGFAKTAWLREGVARMLKAARAAPAAP